MFFYIKNSSVISWVLSFYIFIWFLQIGNRVPFLGSIRLELIVGVFLILSSVVTLFNSKKEKEYFHYKLIISILFFYFLLIIYTFLSYDKSTSWEVFFNRVLKFSMVAFFISVLVKNKYDLIIVLAGFFLAMLKIIQEGIFGIVTGGMIWENQGIPRLHGVTLMYRHPNSLSGLAVGALPFFIFLLRFQSFFIKLFFSGVILGLLMIIMYTGSRTGYVAVIVMAAAIFLRFGLFRLKTIAALIFLALIALLIIPEDYKGRFSTIFQAEEERGSSANKRIEIIEDAIYIAKKYPLGVGIQAFPYVRDMEFGRQQDTHNLYLEVLTNLGPFGLIAFFVFIFALIKTNNKSRQILLKNKKYFLAELCYIINLYIICRLALGLFGMDLYEIYWWFASGFTICLAKLAITDGQPSLKTK